MAASTMPMNAKRLPVSGWRALTPSTEAEAISNWHVLLAESVAPSLLNTTTKICSGSVRLTRLNNMLGPSSQLVIEREIP